jgi:hypothetical protein
MVLAPTGPASLNKLVLTSANPVEIYHAAPFRPLSPFSKENIFVTFTPPDWSTPEEDEL